MLVSLVEYLYKAKKIMLTDLTLYCRIHFLSQTFYTGYQTGSQMFQKEYFKILGDEHFFKK